MQKKVRFLIVEDEAADAVLAAREIRSVVSDCEFLVVETRESYLDALQTFQPDVILSDYSLPRFDGLQALLLKHEHAPLTPLIVWTGAVSEDIAVESMRAGAANYVLKHNLKRLGPAVARALEEKELLLARQQAEQRYRSIFENAMEGIFQSSPQGHYLSVNPAMAGIYGYASPREMIDEVQDIAAQIYVDAQDRDRFTSLLESEGSVQDFETRNQRRDGTVIWTSTSARAVREPCGSILYYEGFVQDITRRKEVEAALENNGKRFRALIENGLDSIVLLTSDGTLLWESPSAIRTLDYAPNQHIGQNVLMELIHPEDLERVYAVRGELLQEPGGRRSGVFRVRHADSTWHWVEAVITNLLHEPCVNAFVINYRDITDRVQAEEAMRQSQAKYQTLVETSHDLIWSVNAEGTITFLNRAIRDIYGYEPQELIGKSFFHLLDSELLQLMGGPSFTAIVDALDDFHSMQTRIRHRDGHYITVSANAIVVRDEAGEVVGVTGTSHDITARKEMEDVLRESESRYRALFENVPVPIWEEDFSEVKEYLDSLQQQGVTDFREYFRTHPEAVIECTDRIRVLGVNNATLRMYRASSQEELLAKINRSLTGSQMEYLEEAFIGIMEGKTSHSWEGADETLTGEPIKINITASVMPGREGDLSRAIVVMTDITERTFAEERIRDLLAFNEKILNHSPIGMLTYRLSGECVFANENAAAIVGTSVEGLLAQNFRTIEAWKKSGLYDLVEKAIATRTEAAGDVHHISTFGKEIWMTVHCVPFRSGEEDHILLSIFDVTERRQAEQALRQSESRYRLATRATNDVIWEWDPGSNRLHWSENAWPVFGYSQEEIGPDAYWWDSRLHPDDREQVLAKLNALIQNGGSIWLEEYRFQLRDGTYAYIVDRAYVERDPGGAPLRMIGAMSDVTTRRRSEIERQALFEIMQGLARTEDLLELLQLIHQSIARVVYAENFFVTLYRAESGLFEEIYSVDRFDPPTPPARLEKSITSYVFRSGEPLLLTRAGFDELAARGEVELVGSDSASWLGVPLKTSGRTIGIMAVQDYDNDQRYSERDREFLASIAAQVALLIERKQAEEALREREEHYRTIFEGVQDAIFVESVEGQILMVNERACEMFGYSRAEFLTKTIFDLVPAGHPPLMADGSGITLSGKPRETLNRRANGEIFPIEISGRLQVINGEQVVLVVVRDMTEHKQAQAAEREQRVLAEALRDTAEMLSSTLDYGEVLDHILAAAGRVVPHDAGTILLIENGFAGVVRSHGYDKLGYDPQMLGTQLSLAETTNLRRMLETRQPEVVYDTYAYPGWKRMSETDWLRSSVGAPISIYGEVIGFICLDNETPEFFTPVHAERLQAFANQAALAMHNAHLLQQAQEEIAERKQAEQELRASEERFRQLADNIQEGFWITDAISGEEIYMSPAIETIWGSPIEHLMQEPHAFISNILPQDRPIMLDAIARERSGERVELEYRVVQSDGSVHWIWDRAFPVFDDAGRVVRIAGIAADITERKQAQEALRESETKANALLNALPDLMIRVDREGTILNYRADPSDAGAPPATAIQQRKIRELAPPALSDFADQQIQRTLESQQIQIFEFQMPVPERGWREYEARMVPSGRDEVIAIVRDITDRKQHEAETQRRADEFAALYRTARDLAAQYNLPTLLDTIAERACALLHTPGGGVYLYDEARQELEMVLPVGDAVPAGARLKLGEGMAGRVARSRELLIVDDYRTWEGRLSHFEGIPLRAVLEVPMLYGGQLIGVLVVHELDESDRKFTEAEAHLLSLFAEYAASAIHAARLMQETRRGAEETSALLQTSLALTSLELEATLQTIGNSAKALFVADGCRIFLVEPEGETLRCVLALQENLAAFSNLRVRIGEGVTGAVASSGRGEIVNEMHNDPRAVHVPGTPENERESIMFAPLKERDRTLGIISIRRAGDGKSFVPADLALLEAFASMAASAVSNARLFEETQRRLTELEALYENGLAVGRLLRPDEIGNRVITTFARYLHWHHVAIRLRQGDGDGLELVAFNLPGLREEERAEVRRHFIANVNEVGQGLSGWAIQTGLPLRTGNVHAHPQYVDTHAGIQSGLYMPLRIGERVIGVISVESEAPGAFTEQDERLLATLAGQAAIAFENARLYQAIEQELLERKRAEEAVRSSETHYRALADSITDILFELDQNLHYTHWNKASEVLTGIPAKQAIGRPMGAIFAAGQEYARVKQIYEDVLQTHQPRTFEITLTVGGEPRSFEVNAYPSMRGVSVVAKDVTDRKRNEIIMQKRFELMDYSGKHTLADLMQRTVDEVSELTGSTVGFFHFVDEDQLSLSMQTWSTNALRLFRIPIEQGTHLSLDRAGVWADAVRQRRPLIQNDYASLARKKGLPPGHVPIIREMVIPIMRNERIMAVMGIANKADQYTSHDLDIAARLADYAWDITERKQMELALEAERNQLARRVEERTVDLSRANSNLARALRVKDEFLANMSHELRTPLNAILGLSESLAEQIAGPLNEKQQKYISTISESGHHLLSLINDILDLAKIDAGQITLDINKVDIRSVCQASLRMVRQLAQKKKQQVSLDIDPGLGLMWADERRLKQMIVNLLGNAVKFTPENGRLGLEVHADKEANQVSITVWDNGIGIQEADLSRLFQPFIQLDAGLARETTGTGLGLALVAQMARLHGGGVTVSSQPGQGSRFTIVLPWEPALALDPAARMRITGKFRAVQVDASNKPTILLVEDTNEVVMMLRDYLELAGYRVFTAQDGLDGLVQARHVKPDLILMDIQMPRMDGFEATRKLRSEPEFRHTPIIALTALAMPNDRERCLAAGMDEYISKPVNLNALVRIIQSCLLRQETPAR